MPEPDPCWPDRWRCRRLACRLDLVNDQPALAESTDPVGVLREAIRAALPPLQRADESPEAVDAVLSTLARSVSRIQDELATMAAAEPGGPVAESLEQLRSDRSGRPLPILRQRHRCCQGDRRAVFTMGGRTWHRLGRG